VDCIPPRLFVYLETVVVRSVRRANIPVPGPEDWFPRPLPELPGLLAPVLAHLFAELGVGAVLCVEKRWWHPIYEMPDLTRIEFDLGVAAQRWTYNDRYLERASSQRRVLIGELNGYYDLFIPVWDARGNQGVLVTGPIAKTRPTGGDIQRRWHQLTGTHGHLGDSTFARYVTASLGTLTLEGAQFATFQRLMSCFAAVFVASSPSPALVAEIETKRQALLSSRIPERMWEGARRLADEMPSSVPLDYGDLAKLGARKIPEHVIVGVLTGPLTEPDPVDEMVRRDTFLRACANWCRTRGNMVSGKVGDSGVVFFVHEPGSATRARSALSDLAARAATMARRFRLKLQCGISMAHRFDGRPARYRAALAAAENAVSGGRGIVFAENAIERSSERLRDLRLDLGRSVGNRAQLLRPRFDRYIEAVLSHSGQLLDPTRAQLAAGLEHVTEPYLTAGLLDGKTFKELHASVDIAADAARNVAELAAVYRHTVAELEVGLHRPNAARKDRGIQRAINFMREHLSGPIAILEVARAAGFSLDYFSKLFKRSEKVSPTRYLLDLRVGRAKQMLRETPLNVEHIQKLCGFRARTHFHRAFKRAVGVTPMEYRAQGWNKYPASSTGRWLAKGLHPSTLHTERGDRRRKRVSRHLA